VPTLENYDYFGGLWWETGSVQKALAYQGVKAPHTGEPLTEAMLMGISGGVVFGYFSFAYEGYDPQVSMLTRNTFHPMQTIYDRLAIPRNVLQTSKPDKAVENLIETLESGVPAIVYADMWLLPYNALIFDEGMWGNFPIVVYGYDADSATVNIADRADVPLTVSTGDLHKARARVKKDKFRVVALDPPDMDKAPSAISKGIYDCIKIYTEAPPVKNAKNNFGFSGYDHWANLLTNPRHKQSWAKVFPPGKDMFAGLTSTYNWIALFGKDGKPHAERDVYADFLDEASAVLNNPALKDAAQKFRDVTPLWATLAHDILPDRIEPFKETRELMTRKHILFLEKGGEALHDIVAINERLDAIKADVAVNFPLDAAGVTAHLDCMREDLLKIRDCEYEAVMALQDAMA
jgi:hypothetical protein